MFDIDKSLKKMLGKSKSKSKDWDGDGVLNWKDCQPRNTMRQDKKVKCKKCGENLGYGDEYDLLKRHMYSCDSKEGRAYMKAVDESQGHTQYCQCEKCV